MFCRLATLCLIAGLMATIAGADGVSVYPTTLILDDSSQVGTLTISNQSDKEAVYELAGYQWTNEGGVDRP